MQLAPPAKVFPQLLDDSEKAAFEPGMVMPLTLSAVVPVLLNITVCDEVEPTFVLANVIAVVESTAVAGVLATVEPPLPHPLRSASAKPEKTSPNFCPKEVTSKKVADFLRLTIGAGELSQVGFRQKTS